HRGAARFRQLARRRSAGRRSLAARHTGDARKRFAQRHGGRRAARGQAIDATRGFGMIDARTPPPPKTAAGPESEEVAVSLRGLPEAERRLLIVDDDA